jgi:hypothetical protein
LTITARRPATLGGCTGARREFKILNVNLSLIFGELSLVTCKTQDTQGTVASHKHLKNEIHIQKT